MRPPEFTGGNIFREATRRNQQRQASMRPPEFTGGNVHLFVNESFNNLTLQ